MDARDLIVKPIQDEIFAQETQFSNVRVLMVFKHQLECPIIVSPEEKHLAKTDLIGLFLNIPHTLVFVAIQSEFLIEQPELSAIHTGIHHNNLGIIIPIYFLNQSYLFGTCILIHP